MKRILILSAFFGITALNAQTGNTGINTTSPKATLDVNLPTPYTKGQLAGIAVPQLRGDEIEAMATVGLKEGTFVYATSASTAATKDVTAMGYWYWKNATDKWEPLIVGTSAGGNSSGWNLDGNAGTTAANYVGTKDAQPLNFKTNANADASNKMTILSGGNVGIGTASPGQKLQVEGNILANKSEIMYGTNSQNVLTRDNAGLQGNAGARSGFFETSNPSNYPAGASGLWHLIDVRHSNPADNYAMQIGGSFFDQNLWYRKTNNSATQAWSRLLSTNDTGSFIQNQYSSAQSANFWISGEARAGSWFRNSASGTGLYNEVNGTHLYSTPSWLNTSHGMLFRNGYEGAISTQLGVAGNTSYLNAAGGNVGVGTTTPSAKLDIAGTARVQTLPTGTAGDKVVVADSSGNLKVSAAMNSGGFGGTGGYDWVDGNVRTVKVNNAYSFATASTVTVDSNDYHIFIFPQPPTSGITYVNVILPDASLNKNKVYFFSGATENYGAASASPSGTTINFQTTISGINYSNIPDINIGKSTQYIIKSDGFRWLVSLRSQVSNSYVSWVGPAI